MAAFSSGLLHQKHVHTWTPSLLRFLRKPEDRRGKRETSFECFFFFYVMPIITILCSLQTHSPVQLDRLPRVLGSARGILAATRSARRPRQTLAEVEQYRQLRRGEALSVFVVEVKVDLQLVEVHVVQRPAECVCMFITDGRQGRGGGL